MEEEDNNKLPVLDLELNVNRKTKKIEFSVHYKKTHTNITIKKRSNHKTSTKKRIIKGYVERAKALCDTQYLESEMKNINEVFTENGYNRREIRDAMTMKKKTVKEENTERGIVVMPNVPNFTPQFNRIARQQGFRVANNKNNHVKDFVTNAKTPLGDENSCIVYNIPCKCQKHGYIGETKRKWEKRKYEH